LPLQKFRSTWFLFLTSLKRRVVRDHVSDPWKEVMKLPVMNVWARSW
jgi:hypothetical protein